MFQIETNLTLCDKMTNFGDMVIYDIHGSKLMDAILTEGAVLERELGKTDVVKLFWNSDFKKTLPVGSYIVPFSDGLKYRLLDDYTPSEGSTSLKYEPAFNHPLAALSRIPFLYDTTDQDGNPIKQQEWSYDGLTTNALEYACKAINEALGITDESKKFTYTLCGTVDPTISFSVSSNDILSVLSSMAQACKYNSSEWHLSWEDHTLYFGQIFINLGEKVPLLKVHDNINFASVNSSNEPYYNCFYPQGSSRNMSRKAQVGLGNVATLVRLGLNKNKFPDGCIYVDKDSNVITNQEFVQRGAVKQMVALSFDDVYPHIDLYAYNVRPRYRYLKNRQTNEIEKDANGKNKVYTTWYMRLAYPTTVKDGTKTLVNTTNDIDEHGKQVTHYWYDYELNVKEQVLQGHTLKATFKVNTHATDGKYDALTQSLVGQPNGQDGFELAYFDKNDANEIPSNHNDGDSGINIKAGDYEIKFYQSDDIIIPTNIEEGLYPRGNNLPDFTCNIVVLFNIKQGQQEIASAQDELAKRTKKEIERRFKDNNNYTFSSNPVAFEEKNPNLHIGQEVIFNDGQGYELSTRIIKIESKIDFPFIQSITVGNQAVKGAITQLKEDVKSILSGNFSGGGGLNASQIETVVKNFTLPRFLRKDVADEAKGHITFWQGLTTLVKSFFNGIVNNGDIRNAGDITNSGNIITNNLTVTGKATFFELEIQKAKAAGGMTVNSAGTFHIDAVEETADGFVCYQRAEKDGVTLSRTCEVNDQMMCSDGMNILKGGKGNHYYWRLVTDAPKEVVTRTIDGKEEKCLKLVLSKTECSNPTDDKPKVGDELAQIGNRKNKERQSVIMTCAYNSFDGELKAPYWVQYGGVNDFKLSTHKLTWFAANGSQVTGNFKVKGAGGGLESAEDYMDRLVRENNSALYKLVENGTRPNLLWGSDLNLDGVDVADKAAVSRRLGAGLVETRMDGGRFRYLKGEGVDGSDALMFRSEKGVARVVGLCFGSTRELRVRPGSVCTMSAWVAFDSHGGQGSVFCDMESWNEAKGGFERVWATPVKADHQYDSKDVARWTRCRWTFRVGGNGRVRFYLCAFTDKSTCDLWLCRPKLEEGEVATPWREYDKTADLERAILDIKSGEITLDARKTTVRGDLTARSLRTEGDPAKGGATIVADGGMITVYGVNKSVPGIEIGLNEAGEPVLRMYKNGKFAYDLGPDTIFEQVAETLSSFTPCDLRRICAPDGQGMERAFGPSFPDNYRVVRAYVFSEGYKKVGGQTMYKVSGTDEPSEYNGAHFAERRDTPDVTAEELEKLRRIADGWYLDGGSHGGPGRVDEPSGDGSDGQGNEMRRFVVRLYANGEATPRTGSFTVSGDGQRGWTVSKVDIPFQGRP